MLSISLKSSLVVLLGLVAVGMAPSRGLAQASVPAGTATATLAYISDTVDIPLRAGASNRHKIIGVARTGAPVTVLKVDTAKAYTHIRTATGVSGWLPSGQLTALPSSQEQLAATRQELEQLKAQYFGLQQHIDGVVNHPNPETTGYPRLYEEALRLRQQLAQYRKVAADTVALDERNKDLQERVVTLERELQMVQQENQMLRNASDNMKLLIGLLILGVGSLVAVLMPRIREQKRAQWSQL